MISASSSTSRIRLPEAELDSVAMLPRVQCHSVPELGPGGPQVAPSDLPHLFPCISADDQNGNGPPKRATHLNSAN
jgi:hypothetical protein